ncbi:MAG: pilin [Candidatus Uhrbacteria bacterium]
MKYLFLLCTIFVLGSLPFITQAVVLTNPLGTTDIRTVVGNIIKAILGLSGVAALLMFVYGGVQWIISGGEPKKVEKGKETLKWAAFGLVFIFISYTLLYTLLTALSTITTTT